MVQHILVAVDGSEHSKKAAAFAASLAEQVGGRLTLLSVLELPTVLPFAPMESFAVLPTHSEAHMDALREMLDHAVTDFPHTRLEKVVEVGRPAEVIVAEADKRGVDLIVLGARGTSAATRLLIGSVSDRVVHTAHKPVTVVH